MNTKELLTYLNISFPFAVLKDILRSKDRDQKGYVNIDELGDCLEAFGFSPDDDDLQFLQVHMDDNGKLMWTPRQHRDLLMTS